MKKIFTLFVALMAFAVVGNAKQVLNGSFSPWDENCTVDGNSITFPVAWAGAGFWLSFIDLSDYDCIVVKFAEPTVGGINICTEYGDPATKTVDENGNVNYKLHADKSSGSIPAGTKITKIDLDVNHADLVAQFWLQGTEAGAHCVVSEVYAGTEEEYQDDLAGNAPEIPQTVEFTLSDLGSGWGDSTYDAATQTITIGQDWSGKGWWLGDVDYSAYSAVVIEFAEATPANGKVVVESDGCAQSSGDAGLFDANCLVKVTALAPVPEHTNQVYIQGPAETQYKLAKAYVATAEYISTNGIVDKYAGTEGIHEMTVEPAANGLIYNLAGQRVNNSYKGVVIRNGRKFVRK